MCGIAGIIDPEGFPASKLEEMAATIRHRGPDDEGYFTWDETGGDQFFKGVDTIDALSTLSKLNDPKVQVGLAHRRLAILDLSEKGHQPMVDPSTKNVIVFNGEIYNYKEIVSELKELGHHFNSNSDTEMILTAFAEWGPNCVQRFVGTWAFAIWNGIELFCSRDRFGIKPFYYLEQECFAFASEIKALLKAELAEPIVSAQSIVQFLVHGALDEPFTNLFSEINELPPGHNLFVDSKGKVRMEQYYALSDHIRTPSSEDPVAQYREAFERAIDLHLVSDVPVGACLSGGLDSSSIVALASQKGKGTFNTFTAAYNDPVTDESNFANMVNSHFSNVEGHECRPSAEGFLADLDKLMEIQELPIGSSSIYAQWKVMELAAQNGMKVLLDGQGADEVLGGYYNFGGLRVIELLRSFRFRAAMKERAALRANFDPNIDTSIARAFFYFLPNKLQRMLRKQKRLGASLVQEKHKHLLDKTRTPERGARSFKQLSLNSIQFNIYELLRYEDRNSMAFSIESRVPFLDHRLVELSLELPTEQKIKGGWTKKILREAMAPELPEAINWRKDKKGFVTPQGEWMRSLKDHMIEKLRSMRDVEVIDKERFIQELQKEQTGAAQLSELFRVYSLVRWMEISSIYLSDHIHKTSMNKEKSDLIKSYGEFYHAACLTNRDQILEQGILTNQYADSDYFQAAPIKNAQVCLSPKSKIDEITESIQLKCKNDGVVIFGVSAEHVAKFVTGLDWTHTGTGYGELDKMGEVEALKISIDELGVIAVFQNIPKESIQIFKEIQGK